MDAQLTSLYGEPDLRFFTTSLMNGKKYTRFMFPDGSWSLDRLLAVCDAHQVLIAYTIWDNVVQQIRIDLTQPYTEGVFYSYIALYYYPAVGDVQTMEKIVIEEYDPV